MTEKNIQDLMKNYKNYEIEMNVLEGCVRRPESRLRLLSGRRTLVDNGLAYLAPREARVLRKHLVDGLSWSQLGDQSLELDLPTDVRALQRIQKRALGKIGDFIRRRFGGELDHLIDAACAA